ncbi:MAG TPA: hypothetical protein VFO50_01595 [Candidatus Limnocylindrales bacterium]|nr:hypothetical protein [Candidatus Limnocylindrales bacterium]
MAGLIGLAVLASACESPRPGTSDPPAAPAAILCVDLEAPRCEQVLADLPAHLPDGAAPAAIMVSLGVCDGPCPGAERGIWMSRIRVQFDDLREPVFLGTTWMGTDFVWEDIPTFTVQRGPRSQLLTEPSTPIALDCWFGDGIDVDGSFWDPVGIVSYAALDAADRGALTFRLTSAATAELWDADTRLLRLVRHAGTTHLTPCN